MHAFIFVSERAFAFIIKIKHIHLAYIIYYITLNTINMYSVLHHISPLHAVFQIYTIQHRSCMSDALIDELHYSSWSSANWRGGSYTPSVVSDYFLFGGFVACLRTTNIDICCGDGFNPSHGHIDLARHCVMSIFIRFVHRECMMAWHQISVIWCRWQIHALIAHRSMLSHLHKHMWCAFRFPKTR